MENQVKQLKNIKINSVDLCKVGANQKAWIQLAKSEEEKRGETILQKFITMIAKMLGKEVSEQAVSQIAKEISKTADEQEGNKIKKSMEESLESILEDTGISKEERKVMLKQNICDFYADIEKTVQSAKGEEQEENTMNLESMTEKDKAMLKSLIDKYGSKEEQGKTEDTVKKATGSESGEDSKAEQNQNKEVQKFLDEEEIKKQDTVLKKALADAEEAKAEVQELKKALELAELKQIAKSYEVLGEEPEELAKTLYDMKKAGKEVYEKYLKSLDNQIALTKSAGIFQELGSSRQGSIPMKKQVDGIVQKLLEADPKMTYEQAFVKACDDNPELRNSMM